MKNRWNTFWSLTQIEPKRLRAVGTGFASYFGLSMLLFVIFPPRNFNSLPIIGLILCAPLIIVTAILCLPKNAWENYVKAARSGRPMKLSDLSDLSYPKSIRILFCLAMAAILIVIIAILYYIEITIGLDKGPR